MHLAIHRSVRLGRLRRGAATVEFALTLPIAILLLFGFVEFSRLYLITNASATAAYEGARRAIVPGGTADQARATALDVLHSSTVSHANVTVDPSPIQPRTRRVTVTVEVPGDRNSWIPPVFFAGKSIVRTCSLSRERTRD
jgi:Flp pilus assembly protein TadG